MRRLDALLDVSEFWKKGGVSKNKHPFAIDILYTIVFGIYNSHQYEKT